MQRKGGCLRGFEKDVPTPNPESAKISRHMFSVSDKGGSFIYLEVIGFFPQLHFLFFFSVGWGEEKGISK